MRKTGIFFAGLCLALTVLGGCAGDGTSAGTKDGETSETPVVVSEDLKPGNDTVFATEKGYYYYSYTHEGFRYVDSTTGKEMYLCNKPECRHDGNEFCVATNDKYEIERVGLYGGRIFATAIEVTETQYKYHLLSLALDGSELNEHVTYLTLEKTGIVPARHIDNSELHIHRNVAMIPLWLVGDDGTETSQFYGTAVIDLDTKEVTYLDEEPFSMEYEKITDITAHGDYFYYCKKEGKKTVLHRYNIKDGTDETHKLLVGFKGSYAVQDDNTVVYTKSDNRILCVYHRETGENEEKVPLKRLKTVCNTDRTVTWERESVYEAEELKTDGDYIYVKEPSVRNPLFDDTATLDGGWDESYIHVFDRELKEIAAVNMAEVMAFAKEAGLEKEEDPYLHVIRHLYFEEDVVYVVSPNAGEYSKDCVYACPKEEFLTGEPKFRHVFDITY